MPLPPYNNARGAATLSAAPPFDFDGVVMRTFPLKASMRSLTRFCDRYLNLMPAEIAVFKPATPYVFLSAINYGRMAPETSSLGWVSQNEVVFSVMLNWYQKRSGRLEFREWASVSPFIYVDEESSLVGGREVFGWPKSLAWLTPGISEWARDPRQAQNLFVLSAMVFPELFAGKRQEPRVLLEIEQTQPPGFFQQPSNPSSPLSPLRSVPEAMLRGASLAGDYLQSMMRLPIQGYPEQRDWQAMPGMLAKSMESMRIFSRLPVVSTLNLKQFRHASDANAVSYQAITSAPMKVVRFNGGGPLGEPALLRGDPTGGYRLRIHNYPTHPIVESLGLELADEKQLDDHSVGVLEPALPFWVSLDLNYGRGEAVCWRTPEIDWHSAASKSKPAVERETPAKHPLNTARGAAADAVTGPFRFPNVTQRVLPLLADWYRLRRFCLEYLDNDFSFFEPWGSYVYLMVTTFEEMSSETYNVGWWANRQVNFSIPVRWYKRRQPRGASASPESSEGDLVGTALLTPFAYTDSDMGATTGREVQGLPMLKAEIESPRGRWLDDSGPAKGSDRLSLDLKVYSALNADQEMASRRLLEITPEDVLPPHDEVGWTAVRSTWGERLYAEVDRRDELRGRLGPRFDDYRALAIELLRGEGQSINEISLRQFRDVAKPERACYQALTLTRSTVEDVFETAEIDEPLHVAIHRYPTQPIVETLGLRVKRTDAAGSSVVDYLQPLRPFWMKMAMRVDLGEDIFWRAGSEAWVPSSEDWKRPLHELRSDGIDRAALEDGRFSPRNFYLVNSQPEVGPDLARRIDADESLAMSLRAAWRMWRWRTDFSPSQLLSLRDARRSLGESSNAGEEPPRPPDEVEPQMVVESLLSNEWGRREGRRGAARRRPEIGIPVNTFGREEIRREFAESFGLGERQGHWVLPAHGGGSSGDETDCGEG